MSEIAVTSSADKTLASSLSFDGEVDSISSQIYVASPSANVPTVSSEQETFQKPSRKPRQQPSMLVGEHIREAIQTIRAKKP